MLANTCQDSLINYKVWWMISKRIEGRSPICQRVFQHMTSIREGGGVSTNYCTTLAKLFHHYDLSQYVRFVKIFAYWMEQGIFLTTTIFCSRSGMLCINTNFRRTKWRKCMMFWPASQDIFITSFVWIILVYSRGTRAYAVVRGVRLSGTCSMLRYESCGHEAMQPSWVSRLGGVVWDSCGRMKRLSDTWERLSNAETFLFLQTVLFIVLLLLSHEIVLIEIRFASRR